MFRPSSLAWRQSLSVRGDAPGQAAPRPRPRPKPSAARRRTGQLHQGRGPDPGPELHRLPQPQEVGEQVHDDDLRPARQGGPAGRRDHARAGRPGRQLSRRADPARRRAADALQAGPACRRTRSALIERWVEEGAKYDGGQPGRGLDGRAAQEHAGRRSPRSIPWPCRSRALAFSPDGREVAASGYHEINLWKTADGTLDRRLRGLAERVYDIAYSPDGKWLATASGDPGQFGSAKLWIAEPGGGGKPVRDLLESHRQRLRRRLQPRQQELAAARRRPRDPGLGGRVRASCWPRSRTTPTGSSTSPSAPTASGSPRASRDKTSKVFDVEKKESLVTFPGHAQTGLHRGLHARRQAVATGGEDNLIRIWNPDGDGQAGPRDRRLRRPGLPAPVHARRQDARRLQRRQDRPGLQPRQRRRRSASLSGPQRLGLRRRALAPTARPLASGSWDGEVRLWNLADGKPVRTIIAAPGLKAGNRAQATPGDASRRCRGPACAAERMAALDAVSEAPRSDRALDQGNVPRQSGPVSSGMPRLRYMVASSSGGVTGRSAGAERGRRWRR